MGHLHASRNAGSHKHSNTCLVDLGWELNIAPHIANVDTGLGTHLGLLEKR